MKREHLTLMMLAAGLTAAAPVMADEAQLLQEARGIPGKMVPKLLEVLTTEIDKNGFAGAISVCREKAPEMAKNLSAQIGWQVRRVSLKNRNPKAVPDAWERATLEEFERRLAMGEKPTGIDKGEIVEENGQKFYRYMKALPTQDLCLNCHGMPERLAPGVAVKLKELYPDDKAVGYGPAEIRGAITAKKPL